ncbi:MAG: zinc-ribbon domain-containing protein, partial [Xanthomonadaceae bacterium]|nr:zinc-ribbon domain-containing protein [Xanthomonadaceae bacterium]
MYTQCPRCRTIFEIGEDALQASLGIVRCGHCSERFDALRTLSDTLPDEPEAALPEHDPDALAPTLTSAVSPETVQAAAHPARKPGSETAPAQPDEAWFDALSGDRARALLADAAGIPTEAIQSDPAWQLTDLPVQTRFAELDITPMAAA